MGKSLDCKECGARVTNCNADTIEVTCCYCVLEAIKPFEEPQKKRHTAAKGFPRGWRFMKEFVHQDGKVYHKGIEQPNLKGAKSPTPIQVKDKKSKTQKAREKAEALTKYNELKKQLKKETGEVAIKNIQTQLKKLKKAL
jgi:hypothetical protein